jgi:hypothetical protein
VPPWATPRRGTVRLWSCRDQGDIALSVVRACFEMPHYHRSASIGAEHRPWPPSDQLARPVRVIEVLEERLAGLVERRLSGREVGIRRNLHRLPAHCPGPGLVFGNCELPVEFDHAVIPLDDSNLGARLVEMVALAQVGREHEKPPGSVVRCDGLASREDASGKSGVRSVSGLKHAARRADIRNMRVSPWRLLPLLASSALLVIAPAAGADQNLGDEHFDLPGAASYVAANVGDLNGVPTTTSRRTTLSVSRRCLRGRFSLQFATGGVARDADQRCWFAGLSASRLDFAGGRPRQR